MTNTITRWECPKCGRLGDLLVPHYRMFDVLADCFGVPVERTYVLKGTERQEFIDALLDHPAQDAAVDWMQRDGDLHETARVVSRVIATAINAVTGQA